MYMGRHDEKAAADLCEEGVGLVCQGIYKEAEINGNLERAEQYAEKAISILKGALSDLRKQMAT